MINDELIVELRKLYIPRDYLAFYRSKYPKCQSMVESSLFDNKKVFVNTSSNSEDSLSENETDSGCSYILFDSDDMHNKDIIDAIKSKAEQLSNRFTGILGSEKCNAIYYKLLGMYLTELSELEVQTSERVAKDLMKTLESSLFKCFACEELRDVIDEYLLECHFLKHTYQIGEVLEDDDFKYIKTALRKPVDNDADVNKIFSKKHDAYEVFYYDSDDDENYSVIISGEYEIGVKSLIVNANSVTSNVKKKQNEELVTVDESSIQKRAENNDMLPTHLL